jgi:hypothetical protein
MGISQLDMPIEEKTLVRVLRQLAESQKENTRTTIEFVDFGRKNTHIGHLQINCLTPNQMVIIYAIDEKGAWILMAKKLAEVLSFQPVYLTCGCGAKLTDAIYEVYKDRQPHCESCMKDAIESKIPVLVRKVR